MDYCKDVIDGSRVCMFLLCVFWKRRLDHGTTCLFIELFPCMHKGCLSWHLALGSCYEERTSAAQDIIYVLCCTEGFCDSHNVTAWAKKLRKVQASPVT